MTPVPTVVTPTATLLPPKDDRPKVVTPPASSSPSKDDRPKVVTPPVNGSPPKEDRPKTALNPLVPLHEAILAAGPDHVWKKVAESLSPLLENWQSDALKQKWRRLASNLAAATVIAAGMAVLWDRAEKFDESDAGRDAR
jgi:hypothetical protein